MLVALQIIILYETIPGPWEHLRLAWWGYVPIHLKHTYNFCCSMLIFYPIPYVFYMFPFVFQLFSWTNLLTRCPMPVSVFCYFCISEKFLKKYSQKGLKIHGDQYLPGTKKMPEGDPEEGQGASHASQARAHPRPRLEGMWGPREPPPVASSPINSLKP